MGGMKTEFNARQILMADMLLVLVAFIWGAGIPMSALLGDGARCLARHCCST